MSTNEREIAIREGHKIHAETSYFTPRPQLDFENARHVFCEGFDRGYIAATTEANKRIAELESDNKIYAECNAELKEANDKLSDTLILRNNKLTELMHSNNHLREALEYIVISGENNIDADDKEQMYAVEAIRALKEVK